MTEFERDKDPAMETQVDLPEKDPASGLEKESTNSDLAHAPSDCAGEAETLRELESETVAEAEDEELELKSDLSTSSAADEPTASPGEAPGQSSDAPSGIAEQPYVFERCTVQIAIQLLPEDGDAKGRPVLLGVRTHLDAPIVRVLRLSELGELPPPINALVEQLKSELPARELAAKERIEKEKMESLQRRLKTAKPPRHSKPATPEKPKTVQTAAAPARSVLTANQRANAVNQAADEKQQLAMF